MHTDHRGPQAHNRIADTAEEQLARAKRGRRHKRCACCYCRRPQRAEDIVLAFDRDREALRAFMTLQREEARKNGK